MKVDVMLGTRPEAIKLAPVARSLRREGVCVRLVVTGQHRDLVDRLLGPLGLESLIDADLDVMRAGQGLNDLSARLFAQLGRRLRQARPDLVVVQGDTTTAATSAIAAFHEHVPVAHVEAGLRTGRMDAPFPEEMNRRLIGTVTQWHFAPTPRAASNLLREGTPRERVLMTGNTVVDSLLWVQEHAPGVSAFGNSGDARRPRVLITLHRREVQGETMRRLARAIGRTVADLGLDAVLPMHPSPAVRSAIVDALRAYPRVRLVEPLGYLDFVATLAQADLVVTDSGGVQEEAPTFGVPTLVVRETTERPEAVEAGCARLVGTSPVALRAAMIELATDELARRRMRAVANPFGDGHAADRIARWLVDASGQDARRAESGSMEIFGVSGHGSSR